MGWRPRENPYSCYCNRLEEVRQAIGDEGKMVRIGIEDGKHHAWEECADAMLEALKAEGRPCFRQKVHGVYKSYAPYGSPNPGIPVEWGVEAFIPDEEEKGST